MDDLLKKETDIVNILRSIYDPEIPVNIYDLGLIYDIMVDDDDFVTIKMTLTAPNCPVADDLLDQVRETVGSVNGVKGVAVNLVFDPPWTKDMISEEALLELGLL